ncbi:MAG TPA: iron chelate uptake ABC transporter family permease subunit, partial [Ktedonobacterales bacterium]|nr:iron chelate uptake ABC transporter family permease subunit [Ktedonobacterales bacterium]
MSTTLNVRLRTRLRSGHLGHLGMRLRTGLPFAGRRYPLGLLLGGLVLAVLCVLHVATGSVDLTPGQVIAALAGHSEQPFHEVIVWDLRLPRTLIALVTGAMFGLAGAILQAIMRNPLAEPEMTGATS